MKIFKLSQEANKNYDTFDSCIVCAENEDDAKKMHPYGGEFNPVPKREYSDWAFEASEVKCEEIGEANDKQTRGVILASFNAG